MRLKKSIWLPSELLDYFYYNYYYTPLLTFNNDKYLYFNYKLLYFKYKIINLDYKKFYIICA